MSDPPDGRRGDPTDTPTGRIGMRVVKVIAGFSLLAAGAAMLALPGPGWLTIAAGLALLAGEFRWARRLLNTLTDTARRIGHQLNPRRAGKEENPTNGHRGAPRL